MRTSARFLAFLLVAWASCGLAGETPAGGGGDNTLDAITNRLAAAKLSIEVDKQSPDKVLDIIRDAAKANIVLDPAVRRAWEDETVTLKLKEVTALSALQHLLRQLEVVCAYGDEALIVTTPKAVQPHPQITFYDIRDLTEGHRSFRSPATLFGSQIDPLYYWYRDRTQLGDAVDYSGFRDFLDQLDLVDTTPPDRIGEILAEAVERQVGGKDLGVSVTYRDGYLVVVQQPKAARMPLTSAEIEKAIGGTTGK